MRVLLAVVALVGCDRVFGLVPGPSDGGNANLHDAFVTDALTTIGGTFTQTEISNNASGTPITKRGPIPSADVTLATRGDGSATAPVTVAADGSFAFTSQLPFALDVTVKGSPAYELQSSATGLRLDDLWVGRIARTFVTKPTTIVSNGANASSADVAVALQSTGLWAVAETQTSTPASVSVDWDQATDAHAEVSLLDAAAGDRLYTLYYQNNSAGYLQLAEYREDQVTLMDGAPKTVMSSAIPLGAPNCTTIKEEAASEAARFGATDPNLVATDYNWQILALPAPVASVVHAHAALASLGETGAPSHTTQVNFGNPFPYTSLFAQLAVDVERSFQLGSFSGTLSGSVTELETAVTGASCPVTLVGDEVVIASEVDLAGTKLDVGTSVTIDRAHDVPLDVKPSSTGAVDFYDVLLYAVAPSDTSLNATLVKRYRATDPHVRIDPSLLVTNQNYVLITYANLGYPNASTGDFITTSVPFGASYVERTFVIAN